MEQHTQNRFNPTIYQQASEWFVEFRAGALEESARRAFYAWLLESPAHMGAYLEVTAIWNETEAIDRGNRWSVDTLIAEAMRDPGNVVPLVAPATPVVPTAPALAKARRARPYAVAAAVLVAALSVNYLTWQHDPPSYSTDIGEQRSIAFSDGSTVTLNSRSRVRVRYSTRERAVDLLEGQALFSVAKDLMRPFIVRSDGTLVRAVGTQFDVYKKPSGTVVTVVEGQVAVLPGASSLPEATALPRTATWPASNSPQAAILPGATSEPKARSVGSADSSKLTATRDSRANHATTASLRGKLASARPSERVIYLSAGEQVKLAPDRPVRPARTDVARATAWMQRQLVFASTPLAEVAEEFNRYNKRQLRVRDAELSHFQIDGVFSSTDPASLLRFLRERPGVRVIETESEIIISSEL